MSTEKDNESPEYSSGNTQEIPEYLKTVNFQDSVTLNDIGHDDLWSAFKQEIYPHWFLDHLDWPSFKVVLRTWLQFWVCMLLTIIDKPSQWLGPSGYVINIGGSIEASGSISIATSILIGAAAVSFMFYGVLCAAVANAITWHMRGYPTKESIMQDLADNLLCEYGDTRCLIEQLQTGRYLTTKCSVIHLFAVIWALTSIGWLSVRYKIFMLSWYFFSIPLALSCVSTVVIPYFDPWYFAGPIVVPISLSSCARVFFSVIIFPTTSNARFCGKIVETCQNINNVMGKLAKGNQHKPSHKNFIDVHRATKKELHSLFKIKSQVQSDKLMSRFEISYSRFLPHHLVHIHGITLEIGSAMSDHLFFYTEIQKHAEGQRVNLRPTDSHTHKLRRYLSATKPAESKFPPYKPIGSFEREMKKQYAHIITIATDPLLSLDDLDELYDRVTQHFAAVYEGTFVLDSNITEWMREADEWRTYTLLSSKKWKRCQSNQLQCAQKLLESTQDLQILVDQMKPCDISDLSAYKKRPIFVQEMAAYYAFASKTLAKRMLLLAKYLIKIDRVRPEPKFLLPWSSGVTKKSWIKFLNGFGGMDIFNDNENFDVEESYQVFKPLERVQARDPESTPPRNKRDLVGKFCYRVWAGITDENLKFALKRALFTAVAYIPIYCRTTCHLFFSKRLGWISAMVALTVSRQAVDGIYGFVVRSTFTVYGCLVACAGWYISRGNPYGHAAVMAVLFAYLSWHRHFCNHLNAVSPIILSLSFVIVSGSSYSIAHYDPIGLELKPGIEVAWVRGVCVIIGLFISLVGTFTPRPYTGKRAIRNLEGVMISSITDIATSVNNFSMERYYRPDVHANALKDTIEGKIIGFFGTSQSADMLTLFLRFEPPLAGAWPKNRYKILTNIQQEVVQILWLIYLMFDEAQDVNEAIPYLLWRLGWTNPTVTHSMYSLLYMSSRAIVTGEPLPAVSPCYLSEMHADNFKHVRDAKPDLSLIDSELADVAFILARLLYERLDGLMLIVKGLVGETFDADTRVYRFDEEFREMPFLDSSASLGH